MDDGCVIRFDASQLLVICIDHVDKERAHIAKKLQKLHGVVDGAFLAQKLCKKLRKLPCAAIEPPAFG